MRVFLALALIAGSSLALAQDSNVPLPRVRPDASTIQASPSPPREPADSAAETASVQTGWVPQRYRWTAPEPEPVAPPRIYQVACPAVLGGEAIATALPPIKDNQCRLQSPLSLEAVIANGRAVPMSSPVVTDCGMATALPGWVADVDAFVAAREDTRIASVLVGTGYACRNVNNSRDGNLSFHGFGDAVDVTGFGLEDGRQVTVSGDWATAAPGSRIIRFAHDAACTRFTTVLGPEANALHADHLHLDLGCHGQRCVARLCE